jgi:hypothetical protein
MGSTHPIDIDEALEQLEVARSSGGWANPVELTRLKRKLVIDARASLGLPAPVDAGSTAVGFPPAVGMVAGVGGVTLAGATQWVGAAARALRLSTRRVRANLPPTAVLADALPAATTLPLSMVGVTAPPSDFVGRGKQLLSRAQLPQDALACSVVLEARADAIERMAGFALLGVADCVALLVEPAVRHDLEQSPSQLLGALEGRDGPHHAALSQLAGGQQFTLIHFEAWVVALRRMHRARVRPRGLPSLQRGDRWWQWMGRQAGAKVPTRLRKLRNDAAHGRTVSLEDYRMLCAQLVGTPLVGDWLVLDAAPKAQPRWLDDYLDHLDPPDG